MTYSVLYQQVLLQTLDIQLSTIMNITCKRLRTLFRLWTNWRRHVARPHTRYGTPVVITSEKMNAIYRECSAVHHREKSRVQCSTNLIKPTAIEAFPQPEVVEELIPGATSIPMAQLNEVVERHHHVLNVSQHHNNLKTHQPYCPW